MRSIILLPATFFILSCGRKENKQEPEKPHFTYFELSYKGGMMGGLSFCVDSNKIFFFPHGAPKIEGDSIKYGILPDSMYRSIDTLTKQIGKMSSQNADSVYCYDCPAVSVKLISESDTLRLFQEGNNRIDERLWRLIGKLESLKDDKQFNRFRVVYFYLETLMDVVPPPPKIRKERTTINDR